MRRSMYLTVYVVGLILAVLNWLYYNKNVSGDALFWIGTLGTLIVMVILATAEFRYATSEDSGLTYDEACLESLGNLLVKPGIFSIFLYSLAMSYSGKFLDLNMYMQKIEMGSFSRLLSALIVIPPMGFCMVYPVVLPIYMISLNIIRRKRKVQVQ